MRLTRKGFTRFLASNPAQVFTARNPWMCPLANYIRTAEPNVDEVCVVPSQYQYTRGKRLYQHAMPVWARAFVRQVDDLKVGDEPPVTAAEALALLEVTR